MTSILTLKAMVRNVLRDIPETRNSDIRLMVEIWKRYYPSRVRGGDVSAETGARLKEYIMLDDFYDLPHHDGIKRIRAHFQNDKGEYLPTSYEVVRQRKINEERWRASMGAMTAGARL